MKLHASGKDCVLGVDNKRIGAIMITKLARGRTKEVKYMAVGTYEITHEKVLESGREQFLKNGYERTNLRELCKGAGITTGAYYRHFEDKAALFSALVEPAVNGLRERYDAAGRAML